MTLEALKAALVSVNVGEPRHIETNRGPVTTAIFKDPVQRRLAVSKLNLEGDRQADLVSHGGVNKAIYGYPSEHYPTWSGELERDDLVPGQFGENLTTRGLLETEVYVGDVFEIGSAIVRVSQPRSPCYKLGLRMGDPRFVKTFMKAGRPGFYFRVEQTGELGVGDEARRIERGSTGITVHELWKLSYGGGDDLARIELALTIDTLGDEWTTPLVGKLEKAS